MKEKKARNDLIRSLYKPGMGGTMGKQAGVSRQRIHQIVHKPGFWRRLWKRLN